MSEEKYRLVDNKLVLLYLIEKMEISISLNQISQFLLEEELMSYFDLQQCLSEMAESNLICASKDNNITSYTITDDGLTTLEFFIKQIPFQTRNCINKYVKDTRETIKQNYEVTANYFYMHETNEFIVKCGVYDEETALMEINISVVTKDQAKLICRNWKNDVNKLHMKILNLLIKSE